MYAYLMLLQVEVTAFHSNMLFRKLNAIRVGEPKPYQCIANYTHMLASSLWPYSSYENIWTAVSRYLVLWSPDFPRTCARDCPICSVPQL